MLVESEKIKRMNVEINMDVAIAFYNFVMKKYGKTKGVLSKEVEKALIAYMSDSTPAPGKELRPEKAESEKRPRVVSPETIQRDLVVFPKRIAKVAFLKLLQKHGYDRKQADQAIGILVTNGIYKEEDGVFVLQEEEQ